MTSTDSPLLRFHRLLVESLRRRDPKAVEEPFTVAEIYQNLVPYRTYRDRLGLDMNGDYEHVLLRLLVGEGELVRLESDAAIEEIREELESSNPNTGVYRDYAAADVRLVPDRIPDELELDLPERSAEDGGGDPVTASAGDGAEGGGGDVGEVVQGGGAVVTGAGDCRWCGEALPERSNLRFCPYCGTDIRTRPCPSCGETLDPDWRFCVACGEEVGEG